METIRQQIAGLLREGPMTAIELSQAVGISEKEVVTHLPHIERSLAAQGEKLVMRPPECLQCGYEFVDRGRFTRPGRCPRCKASRVQRPSFEILRRQRTST